MSNPLVSVIIPAYNHEKYVQETITSIIKQTYENIELIVIDDGSKDTTWQKICELKAQCEKRFTRVYFATKENEGTCVTLNKLIEQTNGEFIYLIASDDLAKHHAIETEVDFLINNLDYSLVVGDNEFIDENSKRCYWDKNRNATYEIHKASYITFGIFLKNSRKDVNFYTENFGNYMSLFLGNYVPNGYLIRKSIFEIIGPFKKEAALEDHWLMLQITKYAKLKYLDEVLFSYRWHNNNTANYRSKMDALNVKLWDFEMKLLSSEKYHDITKQIFQRYIYLENEQNRLKLTLPFRIKNILNRLKGRILRKLNYLRQQIT